MKSMEESVFQLILHGGNSRSLAMEAIVEAKAGRMAAARGKLAEAGAEIAEAHRIQTTLIQREAGGSPVPITLLLIHAQDHLMNAITVKDLATELVKLYERV